LGLMSKSWSTNCVQTNHVPTKNRTLRIAILMIHSYSKGDDYFLISMKSNCLYAAKHGYDCLISTNYPDSNRLRNQSKVVVLPFPSIGLVTSEPLDMMWQKQYVIHAVLTLESLNQSSSTWSEPSGDVHPRYRYDFVLYVDSDACFVAKAPTIESHLLTRSDADVFVARDFVHRHDNDFNAGVLGFRNSDWSRWLLFFWYANPECKPYFRAVFFEQSCLEKLQNFAGYDNKPIKGHLHVFVKPHLFNSFDIVQSTFIFHMAGRSHSERQLLLARFCPS